MNIDWLMLVTHVVLPPLGWVAMMKRLKRLHSTEIRVFWMGTFGAGFCFLLLLRTTDYDVGMFKLGVFWNIFVIGWWYSRVQFQ